jgi:flavin reductase (DIM6/NTAB) family NADH-FMN oxidoreductase RutF
MGLSYDNHMREESRDYVTVAASGLDTQAAYKLIIGCVVPRPIAWITSVSAAGRVNAAPFSSYNYVAHCPPMVAVNVGLRAGQLKDTARNILETREFVVNVATEATRQPMHDCSADFAPDESEAEALAIELIASRFVKPPRIAASPVHMECRLDQAVRLGTGNNTLYIGEVLAFHLSPAVFDGEKVDSAALRPLARLGGPWYTTLGQLIHAPILATPPGRR